MSAHSLRDDPRWREALDWVMRRHAAPDDPALRLALNEWLASDPQNAAVFRRAETVWGLTGEAGNHVRSRTGFRSPAVVGRGRRVVGRRMAVVGALAASGLFFMLPAVRRRMAADLRTGVGETRTATLADGSLVHLDADSAIAIHFDGAGRGVDLLSGQAFFEVTPNPGRPFTVKADDITVRVTGTAFDVRLGDAAVTVAVAAGGVMIDIGDRTAIARLSSGDQLTVTRATGAHRVDHVAVDAVAAWRGGELVVNGATVAEIVETLRRYTSSLILLRDDGLARRRVTGVFDPRHPVLALRAAVTPYAGVVDEPLPFLITVTGP